MRKILKNPTVSEVVIDDTGITIVAGGEYILVPQDWDLWSSSADAVDQIVAGNIIVNDGENDLPIRVGIGLVQDNQVVLNEYYTLVEDDDVLIGNGQILYLNDEFDVTDNVPDYIDEQIEDDPTES